LNYKKSILLVIAVFFANIISDKIIAQEVYATIHKNTNKRASGLFHDLNKTKDTLVLKSEDHIHHIYSINKDSKREVSYYIKDDSYKLPLNTLTKGRHVFIVELCALKIVFSVIINKDFNIRPNIDNKIVISKKH